MQHSVIKGFKSVIPGCHKGLGGLKFLHNICIFAGIKIPISTMSGMSTTDHTLIYSFFGKFLLILFLHSVSGCGKVLPLVV